MAYRVHPTEKKGWYLHIGEKIQARKVGAPVLVRTPDIDVVYSDIANAYYPIERSEGMILAQYLFSKRLPTETNAKKADPFPFLKDGRVIA